MSLEIIEYNGNRNMSKRTRKIEYIVIHYTAGSSAAKGQALSLAQSYNSNGSVSSDYTVDDETVVKYNLNPTELYTWHCGGNYIGQDGGGTLHGICTNANSIGIEVCCENKNYSSSHPANTEDWKFTDGTINLLRELVKKLMSEFKINSDHVVRHFDTAGKLCPGIWGWNTGYKRDRNGKILGRNNEDIWLEFKRSLTDENYSSISSGSSNFRGGNGYYYHPLGDYAEFYVNNERDGNWKKFPHSYHGHGQGKLDFGVGPDLPIYSMTDGVIVSVNAKSEDDQKGYVVVIKTDRVDGAGKPVYINYLEMAGLSDLTAPLVSSTTINPGPDTYSNNNFNCVTYTPVQMGDLIGYTNGWFDGSNLHLDFTYGDRYNIGNSGVHEGFDYPDQVPHLTTLPSGFSKDGNAILCNGYSLGSPNGKVYHYSGSETEFDVFPPLNYMVTLQKPIKMGGSGTSPGPDGGISINGGDPVAYRQNMDQQAVDFYLNGAMSIDWMGCECPQTIQELNNNLGIRYAAAICSRELSFETFSNVAYAKLIRAKIIGETWHNGSNLKEWFENLNESQFAGKSAWLAKTFSTDNDLLKAQLVYKNLRYPDIYGAELFNGSELFKEKIVYGCRQIPIYNLSGEGSKVPFGPHAFIVNFNVNQNKEYGENSGGAGNFLMYRQVTGDMNGFNSKIV